MWLGKMLWDSSFLWDAGQLSFLFTPWVPHSSKEWDMLSSSLPFLTPYCKLLKGKNAIQSLHRYAEYLCVLFHPFALTTRFWPVCNYEKMRELWMKEKMKNSSILFLGYLKSDAWLFQMKVSVCLRGRKKVLVLLLSHGFRQNYIFLLFAQIYQ